MTLRLSRDLIAFEAINPFVTFKVRSAMPLASEPSIVGIGEVLVTGGQRGEDDPLGAEALRFLEAHERALDVDAGHRLLGALR